MTFPKPDDDDQALRSLADMHRRNREALLVPAWISPHLTVELATVELAEAANPEAGSFSTAPAADAEFRRALTRGDFPTVPPTVTAALGAHDRLRELEAAPGRAQLYGDVVLSTVEALLAGRPVDPEEFHAAVHEAWKHTEAAPILVRLSSTMRQQLTDGWPLVVAAALPALLDGLRDPLTAVLTEARGAHAALDGLRVDSPTAAVAAATDGQRKALLSLDDLASRYDRLRNAQQAALAAASPDRLPGYHASEQRAAEPTTWAGLFATGLHECSEVRLRGAIGSGLTGTARLCQVAQRPDVWLPDRAQLDQAYNELFSPRATANDGGPDAA